MSLRIDEEEYEHRDFGMKLKEDRTKSDDEKFYERWLGTCIGMLDYKGSEENVEKHCKKMNKHEVNVEFRSFKVSEGNFKIVKVLLPPRKVNYGRLKNLLDTELNKYFIDSAIKIHSDSIQIEGNFASYTMLEKLRLIQKLLTFSEHKEDLTKILLDNISEAETKLILYMQPQDEREILQDAVNYYRFKEIEEKASPLSKEVVAKRKPE
jgi:hypothetical protein